MMHLGDKLTAYKVLYVGALGGLVFVIMTLILGTLLNDYSSVSQTVSEIGRIGSPFQEYYSVMLSLVSILSFIFSCFLFRFANDNSLPKAPVYCIAFFAVLDGAFVVFPAPEQLHNVVGLLHIVGYVAPFIVARNWKQYFVHRQLRNYSSVVSMTIGVMLFLNLSPMIAPKLYPLEFYGIVQRGLLYTYYLWLTWLSITMAQQKLK